MAFVFHMLADGDHDPIQNIDQMLKALEVHHGIVVRSETKISSKSVAQSLPVAKRKRGIQALLAQPWDVDPQIAWEGDQMYLVGAGVQPH